MMREGVRAQDQGAGAAGRIQGAICIGGAGAHLAGPAFQELPIGFPKLVVSPLASGQRQFEAYVGLRDVAVMHSVADIAGINAITERVFRSAAGYIAGAAAAYRDEIGAESSAAGAPTVVVSMNGNTTKAMDRGRARSRRPGTPWSPSTPTASAAARSRTSLTRARRWRSSTTRRPSSGPGSSAA